MAECHVRPSMSAAKRPAIAAEIPSASLAVEGDEDAAREQMQRVLGAQLDLVQKRIGDAEAELLSAATELLADLAQVDNVTFQPVEPVAGDGSARAAADASGAAGAVGAAASEHDSHRQASHADETGNMTWQDVLQQLPSNPALAAAAARALAEHAKALAQDEASSRADHPASPPRSADLQPE